MMVKRYTWSVEDHAMRESQELGNFVRLEDYNELEADLADCRLIAREQENAHIAANLRNTDLEIARDRLLSACQDSDDAQYGTLSTTFVQYCFASPSTSAGESK